MPDDSLISLCKRSHEAGIDRRHNHASVGIRCREAAVASDDAEHGGANRLCGAHRVDQIGGNVFLLAAASHRENQHSVSSAKSAAFEALGDRGLPALIVDAGGEFGDIVCGADGLHPAKFAEVAHGMRGVASSSPGSYEKHTPAAFANLGEQGGHFFDGCHIKRFGNEGGFFEKVLSEAYEACGFLRLEMKVAISSRLGKQKSAVGCASVL